LRCLSPAGRENIDVSIQAQEPGRIRGAGLSWLVAKHPTKMAYDLPAAYANLIGPRYEPI
jgi:hypothetical protein